MDSGNTPVKLKGSGIFFTTKTLTTRKKFMG